MSCLAERLGAPFVVAGALRDAGAVAAFLVERDRDVLGLAAGEQDAGGRPQPALEDWLGAGVILSELPTDLLAPAARAAGAFRSARADLNARLAWSTSGRELRGREFAGDVRLTAELNAGAVVPLLVDGVFGAL